MFTKCLLLTALILLSACSGFNQKSENINNLQNQPVENNRCFTNPILPSGADPWVIYHDGFYYYAHSDNQNLTIIKSKRLENFKNGERKTVWHAQKTGDCSSNVWAPELHLIDGAWYIYFAADDGNMDNHQMFVIKAKTSDPMGEYSLPVKIPTPTWAIDGTVLQYNNKKYFVWSGWKNGCPVFNHQHIWIAEMKDPTTLAEEGTIINSPDQKWETQHLGVCEGPQILQNNGKVFIIYSASGCWSPEYCQGMLEYKGGKLTDPNSWRKTGPVFTGAGKTYGVGHCSFVKSPDQKEDWIVYHTKKQAKHDVADRCVFIQKFHFNESGYPVFGKPAAPGEKLAVPSGE